MFSFKNMGFGHSKLGFGGRHASASMAAAGAGAGNPPALPPLAGEGGSSRGPLQYFIPESVRKKLALIRSGHLDRCFQPESRYY